MKKNESFDVVLSKDCARAFATSTGLGTVVSLADGEPLAAFGAYNCESCRICRLAGKQRALCIQSHIYGMNEAERFGGKYVYFCPLGLTYVGSANSAHHLRIALPAMLIMTFPPP